MSHTFMAEVTGPSQPEDRTIVPAIGECTIRMIGRQAVGKRTLLGLFYTMRSVTYVRQATKAPPAGASASLPTRDLTQVPPQV